MGWMAARSRPAATPVETLGRSGRVAATTIAGLPVEELAGTRLGVLLPMPTMLPIDGGVSPERFGLRAALSMRGAWVRAASTGVGAVDSLEASTWTRGGGG